MSFLLKTLLAIVMSLLLVSFLPNVHAFEKELPEGCQPIYFAVSSDGEREISLCLTNDVIMLQHYDIATNQNVLEKFQREDVTADGYYVETFNDMFYEMYLPNKNGWYMLELYPTKSTLHILNKKNGMVNIDLDQDTEINNVWTMTKPE